MIFQKITHFRQSSLLFCNSELSLYAEKKFQIYCWMRNCFPAYIFSVIQSISKAMENWFLHYNFCKASWDIQLSGTLTVVESTSSCPGFLQFSKAPTVVQSIYNYQNSLQLFGLPTAVESIFSCREHLQLSKVPPAVESTFTCPTYLQLSRTPPVVECTSNGPKFLQLSRASPVVENTYSCREHFQLSKVPSVLQSDFCQTGSIIENDSTALAHLVHTKYRVINSLCN